MNPNSRPMLCVPNSDQYSKVPLGNNNFLTLYMKYNIVLNATQLIANSTRIVSVVSFRQLIQRHGPLAIRRLKVTSRDRRALIFVPCYIRCRVACKSLLVIKRIFVACP